MNKETINENKRTMAEMPGAPSTQQIVDAARDENSVLHSLFECDDRAAAEAYRNLQAAEILENLTVTENSEA